MSVHFDASGVILNHNFTKEFYTEDTKYCERCQALAADIKTGVSNCHATLIFNGLQLCRFIIGIPGLTTECFFLYNKIQTFITPKKAYE